MSIIEEIASERARQIASEGWTPEHDDEHTTADFVRFIEHYAGLARGAEMQADPDEARKRLVQVAALAVAAAESIERKFLRCPAPLHGDDGTVADCIAKGHCGCDAKPLAPSGGSEAGISAHTGATRAADSAPAAPRCRSCGVPDGDGHSEHCTLPAISAEAAATTDREPA